jgi:hypothetical protein
MPRGFFANQLWEAETLLDEVSSASNMLALDIGVVSDDIHFSSMEPSSAYLSLKKVDELEKKLERVRGLLHAYELAVEGRNL